MLFCQWRWAKAVKVCEQKILFSESSGEKEDFFRSNPKGLTLTGKLIELTLHRFFEFLITQKWNHQTGQEYCIKSLTIKALPHQKGRVGWERNTVGKCLTAGRLLPVLRNIVQKPRTKRDALCLAEAAWAWQQPQGSHWETADGELMLRHWIETVNTELPGNPKNGTFELLRNNQFESGT